MTSFADKIRRVVEQFFALLTRSAVSGSRSTALAPLHAVLGLVLGAFVLAVGLKAPDSTVVLFGWFSGAVLMLELAAYLYLLVNDREALRSERFTLEKMRIEKGVVGDTLTGFRVADADRLKTLPPASNVQP